MPVVSLPVVVETSGSPSVSARSARGTLRAANFLTALSIFVFLAHGYHPYSQDASIYVAGVEKGINPSLFAIDAVFVDTHTRLSIFSHLLSFIARDLRVPLDALLLVTYLASIALFLFACYRLSARIFRSRWEVYGATALAGISFTMPVAATSLLLMDPYVTARSFSTPFSLLAVAACLDRSWAQASVWLLLAAAMHPLMGVHLFCFLAILALVDHRQWAAAASLAVFGLLLSGLIAFFTRNIPVSSAYREAALSRDYYFLATWHWYEILGLIAPIVLMALAAKKYGLRSTAGKLSAACVLVGTASCLASLLYVHRSHPDFLMRLQFLRSFDTIYAIGVILLGGFLVSLSSSRSSDPSSSPFSSPRIWIAGTFFTMALAAMYFADRQPYPASAHIEWPGRRPENLWEQAFLWIRANTPQNAVFAADASALDTPGEDAQGFRALSERSTLNDNKDEGIATVFPAETAAVWSTRRDAELGLNHASDRQRLDRLRPFGVSWILLTPHAQTSFDCPWRNAAVAVCRLGPANPALSPISASLNPAPAKPARPPSAWSYK